MVQIIRGLSSGNGLHSTNMNPWYLYCLGKLRQILTTKWNKTYLWEIKGATEQET